LTEKTAQEYEAALEIFLAEVRRISGTHREKCFPSFPSLPPTTFTAKKGKRYTRIIRSYDSGIRDDVSVHCFVDQTNGDVLKAASWKAPAKGARGNIYNSDHGAGAMTPYGAKYLK
jgi:hypothetical protein